MADAVVVGRVGVDFSPAEPRTPLARGAPLVEAIGGFAGNIGTGLARLGVATAVVSAIGDDGHGEHVRGRLAAEGIDVDRLAVKAGALTQVAFFEAWPPDRFPVTFYRPAPAPETRLVTGDLPPDPLDVAPLVIVSAALLAVEPARTAVLEALERRARTRPLRPRSWTILDLDWRPSFWAQPAEYGPLVERAARSSDVLVGGDAEFAAAGLLPEDTLRGPAGSRLVVLKHGPDGVSLLAEDGRTTLAGIAVEVVCGLGSGDALTAALAAGLLAGLDPREALARGNAAGAIVATRLMCSAAMPTAAEIDALLGASRVPERRGATEREELAG